MSKAVFDTTILVSALLNFVTGGASHDLLRFAAEGKFELYLSDDILEEELRPKVGDGLKEQGGVSWGCSTPPLLHRRSGAT